jgi:hypothetical protein
MKQGNGNTVKQVTLLLPWGLVLCASKQVTLLLPYGRGSRNRSSPPRTRKDASKHTCLCVIPAPTTCNIYHSFEV